MLLWGRCAITFWHSGYFCCKLSVKLNKLQTDINEAHTNKRAELFSPYVENSLLTTFYLFSDSLTTALKMSSNNIEFLIYQRQSKPTAIRLSYGQTYSVSMCFNKNAHAQKYRKKNKSHVVDLFFKLWVSALGFQQRQLTTDYSKKVKISSLTFDFFIIPISLLQGVLYGCPSRQDLDTVHTK